MTPMPTLPASEEELRLAIQNAVRSVAEDFRRRSGSSAPSPQIPVADHAEFPEPPDLPDLLEGQTIVMVDEAEPPSTASEPDEDRRGIEEALGIASPTAEAPQVPAASVPVPAQAPSAPPPESPLVEVPEPSLSGHLLIFSWTALIRVLSILDLAVPAPVRRHKVLLGRIGMALTSLSAAFLAGMVLARLLKG